MTETKIKIRRLVACLAIGEPPDEARRLLSRGEECAKRGNYPLLSPENVAKLYHPHEQARREALALQIQADIEQGLLPCRVENLTTFEALSVWPNRPTVPPDHPLADVLPPNSAPIERRKKAALIREVISRWPDIESNLRHADKNGLRGAAKLEEHGDWNLTAALQWAKENGKLTDNASRELDSLEAMNRLSMNKRTR